MRLGDHRYRANGPIDKSPTADRRQPTASRCGLTLVELLVVIVLITVLVAAAIPVLAPGGDERRLREASRNLNAYLRSAQTRAIQTGRPFGVALRRASEDSQNGADNAAVVRVEYVETPPPYAGFDDNSLARICVAEEGGVRQLGLQFVRHGNLQPQASDSLPPGIDYDLTPDRFFRPGDQVVVGGHTLQILPYLEELPSPGFFPSVSNPGSSRLTVAQQYGPNSSAAGYFQTAPASGSGGQPGLVFRVEALSSVDLLQQRGYRPDGLVPDLRLVTMPDGTEVPSADQLERMERTAQSGSSWMATRPMPFKVYRQPVPAAGEPLEMPSGTAIDLQASVFGSGRRLYDPRNDYLGGAATANEWRVDDDPILILFSPEGPIHRIYGVPGVVNPRRKETVLATTSLALLVGRRSAIPGDPTLAPGGTASARSYGDPIDLSVINSAGLSEDEAKELTDQFNWLNLESRWVVVGGQSGSIATVDNSAVYVPPGQTAAFGLGEQLSAALENAPRRATAGGR